MRVLFTGFGPFAQHNFNPSQDFLIRLKTDQFSKISHCEIHIFEVCYQKVDAFVQTFDPKQWDLIISLGLSARSQWIHFEKFAYNLDDCEVEDSKGEKRNQQVIVLDEPSSLKSALHFDNTLSPLMKLSEDPGRYLCNHLYFRLLLKTRHSSCNCLFLHIPQIKEWGGTISQEILYIELEKVIDQLTKTCH